MALQWLKIRSRGSRVILRKTLKTLKLKNIFRWISEFPRDHRDRLGFSGRWVSMEQYLVLSHSGLDLGSTRDLILIGYIGLYNN